MIKMGVADNMLDVHANIDKLPSYLRPKKHGYPSNDKLLPL
jgi:hypothetical protein